MEKSSLPVEDISDWTFYIDIDLGGEKITAGRSIGDPGIICVDGSNLLNLPLVPEYNENKGFYYYKHKDWKNLLGISLFNIPSTTHIKYMPTFRTLISYFIRTGIDAYSTPFSFYKNQSAIQIQVANAFLLGMNWLHPIEVQKLKEKEKSIKMVDGAIKSGMRPSKGELEAEKVRLQHELEIEEKALSTFKVHPQYRVIQEKADSLTKSIHLLADENIILRRKLDRYEESVQSEKAPDNLSVADLYEEAGLHFSSALKKTLEETRNFHNEIVRNRKLFLEAEIEAIKNKIGNNEKYMENISSERAEIMEVLSTHHALEEYSMLQNRVTEKKVHLEKTLQMISEIQEMSEKKKEIRSERIELDSKIQRDFEESRPRWEKAVNGFNDNSQALYNEPGYLIINTPDGGRVSGNAYSFDVDIPRSNSEGVGKMKIFCYDLMLVDIFSVSGGIDFLIHDSTMFDGVDSRQIAHALEHGHYKARESGFQYICTFNSDMIPYSDLSDDFKADDFICLRLNDKNPEDSLFGFQFELSKRNTGI
ncbi:DUF2326 domain-containing protein [Methanoplanus limicola]|uniref:DUF2326 domain-containing protein n=1 Tax=Methanoplanus limicola TaxID=2315 RepID=UPI001C253AFD|nr:DUF2326 domain-containing protein [Methanoplanus limicola]